MVFGTRHVNNFSDDGIVKKVRRFSGYTFLVIIYLLASSTNSFDAELSKIIIRNTANELLVDLNLTGFFTEEMRATVTKGIPIDISFSVSFYEVRNFWFDKKLISKTVIHQIRFDMLQKKYEIFRSWEKRGFRVEADPGEAQKTLSEIKGLKVIPLNRLEKGTHYQLRIKSKLKGRNYLFSGTPWAFETDWYTINFFY